jgi:hypothetical protein
MACYYNIEKKSAMKKITTEWTTSNEKNLIDQRRGIKLRGVM